jgi:hypothetical protein
MWYQENLSFKTDLCIIFLTAYSIIFPKQNLTSKFFKNLPQENSELKLADLRQVEKRKKPQNDRVVEKMYSLK